MAARRVVFRADANGRIGFGHFMRSSALKSQLENEFECHMVSLDPDSGDYGRQDEEFTASIGKEDIVVLDNYYFDTAYQRHVRQRAHALVCIDDMPDKHYVADLFLTFSPLPESRFSLEHYTRFYGGVDRAFLREPFLTPVTRKRSCPPQRALLIIGGADPLHLTDRMLGILLEVYTDMEIDVVSRTTPAQILLDSGRVETWSGLDASRMVQLMDRADFGIFPASTVCVEAFARQLPVAAGFFVDNQIPFYTHGTELGWWLPLGDLRADRDTLKCILGKGCIPPPPKFDFAARHREITDIFKSL